LKAQITRITSACTLVPNGLYKVDDDERKIVFEEDGGWAFSKDY